MDGEGAMWIGVGKAKNTRLGYRVEVNVAVHMKQESRTGPVQDVLMAFCDEIGVNATVKDSQGGDAWYFEIHSNTDATTFLEEVKPYVRLKDDDIEKMLSIDWDVWGMTEERFIEIMQVRDELRKESNRESKYNAEYFEEEFR